MEDGCVASFSEAPALGKNSSAIAYDVFLSHCGSDCKRDLADMLQDKLEFSGVRCFFDDQDLEPGDNAGKSMLAAMQTAKLGVVILTRGFFLREWCVKELQTFLARGNVIPIFVNFEVPAEGEVDGILDDFDAFEWTAEEYLDVVRGATNYTGIRLEALDGYWSSCIAKVKKAVLQQLGKLEGAPTLSEYGQPLVGLDGKVEDLKRLFGMGGSAEGDQGGSHMVGIVAVKGMGGVGKTTLAKRVYDDPEVRAFFGGRICWVSVNQKPHDRICQLQKQILEQLAKVQLVVYSPEMGRALIHERLGEAKVLIVLDDVWADGHPPIVSKELLGPGSCILQTTRDAHTIQTGGHKFDLDVLGPAEAEQLFAFHASKGRNSPAEHPSFCQRTLDLCAGLPLAVSVLGSAVANLLKPGDPSAWEEFLEQFAVGGTRDGRDMQQVLRSSFDALPSQELKDAFILIAWVWKKLDSEPPFLTIKHRVIPFLGVLVQGGQRRAEAIVQELESRSLIQVQDGGSYLDAHDLLVDVAASIAENDEDKAHRGGFVRWEGGVRSAADALASSKYQHAYLGTNQDFILPLHSLRSHGGESLMVRGGLVGLSSPFWSPWGPGRGCDGLRVLHISSCESLKSLPRAIGQLRQLRILELCSCTSFSALPTSLGQLSALEMLILVDVAIKVLPESLGKLTALRVLHLDGCGSLRKLPKSIGHLLNLQTLAVTYCEELHTLPESLGRLTQLKSLDLDVCKKLRKLPESVGSLQMVESVSLDGCEGLRALPKSMGQLANLTSLDLDGCSASLEGVPMLKDLKNLTIIT